MVRQYMARKRFGTISGDKTDSGQDIFLAKSRLRSLVWLYLDTKRLNVGSLTGVKLELDPVAELMK